MEPASGPPSDEEVMLRVAGGDRNALRTLVERHGGAVHRLAARLLGNAEDARDAAQDVFVSVFRSAGAWRPDARFTTWLYRVTANRCLTELESRKTRSRLLSGAARPEGGLPPERGGPASRADAEPPDVQMERRERSAAVLAALDALPPRQRTAVVLHRFEGLGYAEIAASMGCSVGSVESLLSRAKAELADRLAGR